MLPMIKVKGLSKLYHLGERQGYTSFRETIISAARAPLRRLSSRYGIRCGSPWNKSLGIA